MEPTTALRERLEQLATLNAIGEVLNQEATFATAADRALAALVDTLGLAAGWLFVTRVEQGDSKGGRLTLSSCHGLPPALAAHGAAALREAGCECQTRFRHGRLDAGVNIVRCSRLEAAAGDTAGLEVHASIPLLGRSGPVGIMNLAAPGRERFDDGTLAFLTAVGRQLGIAFERSRLVEAHASETRHAAALEERQRLAVEMHDSVAQLLFAAELSLRTALATGSGTEERVGAAADLVTDALDHLRALVEVLRPADADAPLHALVRRLAERLSGALDVAVEGVAPDHAAALDERLGSMRSQTLYRVAQEATHNVLKHAQATRVWLRLDADAEAVTLSVADDGVGATVVATRGAAGGLGLASLRRRLVDVGGTLSVAERTGGGTVVEARVPWPA